MTSTTVSTSVNSLGKVEKLAVQPGARGERRCFCQGEVLMMLAHYGWIKSLDDVDHPDAGKTGGCIYVHEEDVVDGCSLMQGDHVSFYLYTDDQGLGAEACQVTQAASLPVKDDSEAIDVVGWSKVGSRLASSLKLAFEEESQLLDAASPTQSESEEFDVVPWRLVGRRLATSLELVFEEEAKLLDSPSDDDSTSVGTSSDSDEADVDPWGEVSSGIGPKLAGLSDDDSCIDVEGKSEAIDVLPWRTAGRMLATSLKGVFEDELKLLEDPGDDASTSAEATSGNEAVDVVLWGDVATRFGRAMQDIDSASEWEAEDLEAINTSSCDAVPWHAAGRLLALSLNGVFEEELHLLDSQPDGGAETPSDMEAVDVASWGDVAVRFSRAFQDADSASECAAEDSEAVDVLSWGDVASRLGRALQDDEVDVAQWSDVANRFATALLSLDNDTDDTASEACSDDFSGADGDLESNDGGDNASICSDDQGLCRASFISCQHDTDMRWDPAPVVSSEKLKSSGGSSDESTSIGTASDPEDNVVKPWACLSIRPPPGLSLPPPCLLTPAPSLPAFP